MSGDALAEGKKRERTYFRRLFNVLGAKGVVILIAFPGVAFLSSDDIHPVVAGGVLAGAFVYAVIVDSDSLTEDIYPGSEVKIKSERSVFERLDVVGLSFVFLVLGYLLTSVLDIGVDWRGSLAAAVVVFSAVIYDYFFRARSEEEEVSVDVVGFAVAEVLVFYSIVMGTGWEGFANSATFGGLAFLVYGGTIAAFAGHAVVTREVIVSRTGDDVHVALLDILEETRYIQDEESSREIASKVRQAAKSLDGVPLPTSVEDNDGPVPIVVSTRKPDWSLFGTSTEEILEAAKEQSFTGYSVYGNNVLIFRNGSLSGFYVDGEYGYEADELNETVTEATFHSTDHTTLNSLDGLTPTEESETESVVDEFEFEKEIEEDTPEKEADELEEEKEEKQKEEATKLDIGGNEIDVEEMFEKADEVLDELD
jgi:hypothetical protein